MNLYQYIQNKIGVMNKLVGNTTEKVRIKIIYKYLFMFNM